MQAPGSGPAAGFGPTPAAGFRPTPLAGARPRHSIKVQKSGVALLGWFGPKQTNLKIRFFPEMIIVNFYPEL